MNPFIQQQLAQVKNNMVQIDSKFICLNDISGKEKEIIFSKRFNQIDYNCDYLFVFHNSVIKSMNLRDGYNNQQIYEPFIPLKIMRGRIVAVENNSYLLHLRGIKLKTESCLHCLRFGEYETLCQECQDKLNQDIENITWRGYVCKFDIKKMEKIEEDKND